MHYDPGSLTGERTFMDMKVGQTYDFSNSSPSLGVYRLKRVEKPPMFGGRKNTMYVCGCFVFESVECPSLPLIRESGSGRVVDWQMRFSGKSCSLVSD